jgi:hypothetical protein
MMGMLENRMLRKIFEPKRDTVTREWWKLYNAELHDLCSSHIIQVIKEKRIRWVGHVSHMGEMRGA